MAALMTIATSKPRRHPEQAAKKIRNSFTPEEDKYLIRVAQDHRFGNQQQATAENKTLWQLIAQNMNTKFRRGAQIQLIGKQCRERYLNHVDPSLDKSLFTEEDEHILISLHKKHGNKWADITRDFPLNAKGLRRAENDIKNIFKSCQRNNKSSEETSGVLAKYVRGSLPTGEETPKPTRRPRQRSSKRLKAASVARRSETRVGFLSPQPVNCRSRRVKARRSAEAVNLDCGYATLADIQLTIDHICSVDPESDDEKDCVVRLASSPAAGCGAGPVAFCHDRLAYSYSPQLTSSSPTPSAGTYSSCESSYDNLAALAAFTTVDSAGERHNDDSGSLPSQSQWLHLDGLMEPNDIPLSPDHLDSSSTDAWRLSLLIAPCESSASTASQPGLATQEVPPGFQADLKPPAWLSSSSTASVEQRDTPAMGDNLSAGICQRTGPLGTASLSKTVSAIGSSGTSDVADRLADVLSDECCDGVQKLMQPLT